MGLFRVVGQPNLNFIVDRQQAARFGINVSDIQDAIQTAVGGGAVSQVLQGEQRYDLMVRYQAPYRDTREAIENIRLLSPSGERVSLVQLCKVGVRDGASEIYREENSRYVAIKYSVRGRDLGSTVEQAIRQVNQEVKLPVGYHIDWAGEYANQQRSQRRLLLVLPITILVIFIILYSMFRSAKWALLILAVVAMAPIGGLLALLLTGTHFSVSSGVGFLALFGVSVQTGVIVANTSISSAHGVNRSSIPLLRGAVLRLRPHHDDGDACGDFRTVARSDIACDRFQITKTVLDCHSRRPDHRSSDEYFPATYIIRMGCKGRRRAARAGGSI